MKNTKKSLLLSVTALILCCALLAGTTLAWFTDSVSSGVNTIKAGNLDIELYYATEANYAGASTTWEKVTKDTKLFNPNGTALFEPGYTETVYLKAVNEGTLALDYKFSVDVISEVGSINQKDGSQFKLSDYLVFGLTDYESAPEKFANREAVWAAIGNNRGNLDTLLSAASTLREDLNAGAERFFTLSVYMPTTVGNEANYDRAYNAPEITFGLTVLASQASYESDSFDNQYDIDNNATHKWDDPTYVNTTDVVYPAKIEGTATGEQANSGLTLESDTKVTLNGDDKPVLTMKIKASDVDEGDKFAASAVKTETPAGITVESGKQAVSYEVTLTKNGREVTGSNAAAQAIEVQLFVGTKLTNVKVYHNAVEMNTSEYSYNPATGFVTFSTNSFSPFTITYTPGFALVKDEAELRAAVKAGNDVRLANDIVLGSELYLKDVPALVLDGNGHKITAAEDFRIEQVEHSGQYQLVKIQTTNAVTLQNITLEHRALEQNAQNYHTLDIYGSNVTLSNVTLIRDFTATRGGAPLVINTSTVTAKNSLTIVAGGNAWYGFNVDGKNVSAALNIDANAKLNITVAGEYYGLLENGGQFTGNTGDYVTASNGFVTLPAVKVNDTKYATLEEALAAVSEGATVTILKDITTDNTWDIKNNITIEGGDHTITFNKCAGLWIKNDLNALTANNLTLKAGARTNEQATEAMADPFMGIGTYNLAYGVADLNLTNVTITGFDYGMYFSSSTSNTNPVKLTANKLVLDGNLIKGAYIEKLTESTFTDCTVKNNGADMSKVVTNWQTWMAGVDINLKYGTYQNISFVGCAFDNNGANSGKALMLKARGTGGDSGYAANPATLTNVTVDSTCTFTTGNANNIISLGEPTKGNQSPTDVTINADVDVLDNRAVAPFAVNGKQYYSLQTAVAEASNNATVTVKAGTHAMDKALVINKPVTIQGEEGATLDFSSAALPSNGGYNTNASVLILSDGVTLKDMTVIGKANAYSILHAGIDDASNGVFTSKTVTFADGTSVSFNYSNGEFPGDNLNVYEGIRMEGCTFKLNEAGSLAHGLFLEARYLYVTDCTFENISAKSAIIKLEEDHSKVLNATYTNCSGTQIAEYWCGASYDGDGNEYADHPFVCEEGWAGLTGDDRTAHLAHAASKGFTHNSELNP